MEAFATSFTQFYPDDVAGLRKRIDEIGVKFAAITGGARSGDIHFLRTPRRGKPPSKTIWAWSVSARSWGVLRQ